ncbi:MAG: AIR carboxylase family protein [Candidatus Micrarchaeota archaeon]
MANELVPIIIGSKADEDYAKKVADHLKGFGIETQIKVCSAHKATKYLLDLVKYYDGLGRSIVYVAIAGRSNALGGVIDGNSANPVINNPPHSEKYGGMDLLSSLRMPSGIVPATILEAENAALLAVKLFAMNNSDLKKKLESHKKKLAEAAAPK